MKSLPAEIIRICRVYEQYLKKTDEIITFTEVARNQKDFVAKVEVSQELQDYVRGLRDLSNSVVLYNAAIISIYGSYELFLNEILAEYIDYLMIRNASYNSFPKSLKDKHLFKSAEFLTNPQRFLNMGLDNETVISALEASYVKDCSSALLKDLLLMHGGNLKTKQLKELLTEFAIPNPIDQLVKHFSFKKYGRDYKENSVLSFLDLLVEERNKASHGWVIDNRLAFSLLQDEYIPFIKDLCKAIKDLIVSQIIGDYIKDGVLFSFDPIIHLWDGGKIIGINCKDFRLKVDEYLFYTTDDNWNYYFRIVNLQNDKQNRIEIRSFDKDIAIQTDRRIKENYTIWGYKR